MKKELIIGLFIGLILLSGCSDYRDYMDDCRKYCIEDNPQTIIHVSAIKSGLDELFEVRDACKRKCFEEYKK